MNRDWKRFSFSEKMMRNYSTFAIARLLQVDPGSVANWIDQGRLKAHRTPGKHRRVAEADLVAFLVTHDMPIPDQIKTRPERILIVESEPSVAETIRLAIQAGYPQYEVIEAHDGFRAGALLAEGKPALVILDLKMPGVNGFDICRSIKSHPQTSHIHVLATSPQREHQREILDCGARACLKKPIDVAALMREVQALLIPVRSE